jgi:hypothetical protein
MTNVYIQFIDDTQTVVGAWFASPQDPEGLPNYAVIQDDDQRYLDFLNPPFVPPTEAEITAANVAQQDVLITQASQVMAPILVSLQLGDATDDETLLAKAWQVYYRALKLVDCTVVSPEWPTPPTV